MGKKVLQKLKSDIAEAEKVVPTKPAKVEKTKPKAAKKFSEDKKMEESKIATPAVVEKPSAEQLTAI